MVDLITTDDLYGSSNEEPKSSPLPVPIEETLEIVPEVPVAPKPPEPVIPKKRSGCFGFFIKIVLFAVLVAGGVWLSSFARQFFTSQSTDNNLEVETSITPTIATVPSEVSSWKSYDVISGTTKLPFAGVTFQLPPDVLSPICDGTSCTSQGTYLPGGTRFTVAPRGAGQALADFRGTAIADVGGVTFTTKSLTVAGLPATEFTGSFTGRTVSGYGFSTMRGVMIELTPTTSLEVNHFTPNGIVADFAADDTLFDEILKTVTVARSEKGNTATSSGY